LSPALDTVCGKAMAKAAEQRYASMKDFAAALTDVLRTLPAKEEAGAEVAPKRGKSAGDIFDLPTAAPQPPPVPKALSKTIPEALPPGERKGRKAGRKRRVADPPPLAASRSSSVVIWLCLALLLGGGAVIGLLMLRGGRGPEKGGHVEGDKPRFKDKEKELRKENGRVDHTKDKKGPVAGERPDEQKEARGMGASFTNEFGMKLVRIPPGTFKMGSPRGEANRIDDEEQHSVEITQEFWLGVHEVTQKQYAAIMGKNPSWFSKDGSGKDKVMGMNTDDFPVENVSWDDAVEFCKKLSERDTKKPAGWMYRLPREAEWEYSCRGGAPSYQVFHFGNSLSGKEANFGSNNPHGGAAKTDPLNRTCKVGSYAANRFGLHDMHGNVWEWCLDWYGADYYAKSPAKDPAGPPEGSDRVDRGGSWGSFGSRCRSASRRGITPGYRDYYLGFRVALVPSGR
jgi:formylglycine-generating enzyme required for sulfatase activity